MSTQLYEVLYPVSQALSHISSNPLRDLISLRCVDRNCRETVSYRFIARIVKESVIEVPFDFESCDEEVLRQYFSDIFEKHDCEKECIEKGRNIFVTGGAGTGKSYYVESLVSKLRKAGKVVLNTSTTGLSASCLENGCTIHKGTNLPLPWWLDKFGEPMSAEQAATLKIATVCKKKDFSINDWKVYIQSIDYLRIEEISMLSKLMFEYFSKIWGIARNKPNLPFGGVKVIISGDFFQLPPIKDKYGKDKQKVIPGSGDYCFKSNVWKKMNIKTINLQFSYRQMNDPIFTNILNRIRIGEMTEKDLDHLYKKIISEEKNKELQERDDVTKLYPVNAMVNNVNEKFLLRLPGNFLDFNVKMVNFKPESFTNEQILKDVTDSGFEPLLKLKIGCRLMLTKNISMETGLVNGRQGTLMSITKSHPKCLEILFDKDDDISSIPASTITRKDEKQRDSYKFSQYPVRVCYALSIHKSQGLTVSNDLLVYLGDKIFDFHQAYVALSRATSFDNIYIERFDTTKIKVSEEVKEFYGIKKKQLNVNNNNENSNKMVEISDNDFINGAKRYILKNQDLLTMMKKQKVEE